MDKRSQWLAITLLAGLILSWLAVRALNGNPPLRDASLQPVIVEIRGDVRDPGVYLLPGPTATVADALRAAGAAVETPSPASLDSSDSSVQLPVRTGQLVWVQDSAEVARKVEIRQMDAASRLTLGERLTLNEATEQELLLVPQMKPEFASAIVSHRTQRPWKSLDELKRIPGIGAKTVARWKQFLQVESDDGS